MKDIVKFHEYERISDVIMYLNQHLSLKINVNLNRKTQKTGIKKNFYEEYKYSSSKYGTQEKLVTVRRHTDVHLGLEYNDYENGIKEGLMIRPSDIIYLRNSVKLTLDWFMSDKYKNLFVRDGESIRIKRRVEPIFVRNLAMDKFLAFEPTTISKFNGTDDVGVKIYISSDTLYTDVNLNSYMAFVYYILECNMYLSAQIMMNLMGMNEEGRKSIGESDETNTRRLRTFDDT
jgi:hypothetical protein